MEVTRRLEEWRERGGWKNGGNKEVRRMEARRRLEEWRQQGGWKNRGNKEVRKMEGKRRLEKWRDQKNGGISLMQQYTMQPLAGTNQMPS